MFPNLDAEQARHRMTNEQTGEYLNLSRVSYEKKKKQGRFTPRECKKLCQLFHVDFEYLFEEENEADKKEKEVG